MNSQRYNKIYTKTCREIILLKSLPCIYSKCSYCNYILDNTTNLNDIISTNNKVIQQIDGEFAVLEVINSGSIFEIPKVILNSIKIKANTTKIKTLYFESYYGYRKRLHEMREFFPNQEIRYRIGIETFNDKFRRKVLNKPFPTDDVQQLAQEHYSCLLLICIQGQTKEQILYDIDTALKFFKEVTINVYINNSTKIKRDPTLVKWFIQDIYPTINSLPNVEILLDNKDLGVFVQ